jgi:hypothetical protein
MRDILAHASKRKTNVNKASVHSNQGDVGQNPPKNIKVVFTMMA